MTRIPDAPADTRMMDIVHDALRRDLARAVDALSASPGPDQQAAIADHVVWMTAFLHSHHGAEDDGLWPLLRDRDPSLGALLDEMDADHARIDPLVATCRSAAEEVAGGTANVDVLAAALRELSAVLLPHLDREEQQVMPRASLVVTEAELRAVDRRHVIEPKPTAELALELHWLLDGLDGERALLVRHQVPAPMRPVLLHGFRRRYLRQAVACWGTPDGPRRQAYAPAARLARDIPPTGRAEVVVDAPIDAVWAVVSDPTRVGEWSHECRTVEWMGTDSEAVPGARFRGTNKAGIARWSRTNEVVAVDPGRSITWRTIPGALVRDSSEWRIALEPVAAGTRIVQTYEVVRAPVLLRKVFGLLLANHRDRSSGLRDDLRRIGEVAAAATAGRATAGPRT